MRVASQEREGSMRGGGGEYSVDCTEEGAGKWAGGVWTGGKEGKMKQGPPCGRRGHGDEEGDFCVGMGAQDGDLVSTGDLSSGWALCAQAEEK